MKTLTVTRDARGVARVTMARPDVFNALHEAMVAELDTTFAELGADDSVRVIVLTGEGKAFSAGADLEWMQRASGISAEWNRKDVRRLADMLWRVDTCPKPTIARVNGIAFGSGVGLVHQVVPAAKLDAAVDEQIDALLANGPRAQREIKSLFARIAVGPITGEVRELTVKTIGRVRGTDEARQGLAAFVEKRPASWTKAVRA